MQNQSTERQRTEAMLNGLLAKARTEEEAEATRNSLLSGLFSRAPAKQDKRSSSGSVEWPVPRQAPFPKIEKADRRSDFVVAALGITLSLICALFPWYIFFNQEQFGVQAIKFGGKGNNAGRIVVESRPGTDAAPLGVQEMSRNLDLFTTGNVADEKQNDALGVQPFPGDAVAFRLVHIANGRAMIEDDAGLWIVQNGSKLPDSSRVAKIEQRSGKWVLVTSTNKVLEIVN
ncbi:hypothetical protein ASD64_06085 [Mesorhizobium sp. Root157]|uniref:hypothetical protein n=1 Tax=Mesorhizobium sp. Root157 TaxID=1736477 RepID=UPI0006FBEDE1|nr:hypothetical protein [Mesorhizobium sp. Root157]KQZ87026.1 hypothetical protein ASD64_06085 [Mesorhizobium sp. Root157]